MMSREVSSDFYSGKGKRLSLEGVVSAMQSYIERERSAYYEIVIGSDSQASLNDSRAAFITAVVLRRIGNGGIHFWTRKEEKFYGLRDRIWKETMLSITLAQELRSLIKDKLGEEFLWEKRIEFRSIHLDVGERGPTKELVDSVSGVVKGYGFVPVIKPYSYGAFVVADVHT